MKSLLTSIVLLLFTTICLAQTGPLTSTSPAASSITTFPYLNDFEVGIQWSQSSGDDFDWSRLSGGTPSSGTTGSTNHTATVTVEDSTAPTAGTTGGTTNNSSTSTVTVVDSTSPTPQEGLATGSGTVTTQDSFSPKPKTAVLISPSFDLRNSSRAHFSFSYWIEGNANTLQLEISTDGVSWSTLWSQAASTGSSGMDTTMDFSTGKRASNVQLRFKAIFGVNTSGNTWQGDMSVDDLSLTVPSSSAKRTLQEAAAISDTRAFPNPFQNQFSVAIPYVENQTATIMLYDINGRQVFFQSGIQTGEKFNLQPRVNPGVYVLCIQVGTAQHKVKMIKTE